MTDKQMCFLFFVNIKREMNICCSPAVEDPGKECDKDGGGEVDDRRQTSGPGIRQPEIS